VSRVVNGKGRVSPRTRERVQAAIAQLGYRPNSVARALVTARSGIIGVVTTTSAHFGPSSMLIALEITAREAGFFTSVVALDRFSVEDVVSAFDHFSSLAAEAIIVITPMDSLAEAVAAQGASVPVIAVSGGHAFGRGVSVVRADQRGGARELAEHLLSLGHRDIACVAGPQEWFVARERMAGWREAMDEAGLPKREPLIGLWEASWGYAAGQLLVEEGLPDAIMCANDEVAVGLLHAFAEAGVSVPGDVSVAGFDDVPLAAYVGPGLTTVHQDFADLGRCAMEAVSQALEGGSADTYVRPTRLVVRGSTGACAH
jgi:transcriptional regulator, lacI family